MAFQSDHPAPVGVVEAGGGGVLAQTWPAWGSRTDQVVQVGGRRDMLDALRKAREELGRWPRGQEWEKAGSLEKWVDGEWGVHRSSRPTDLRASIRQLEN